MSQLADRHIELNAALRKRTVAAVTRIWEALPEYRDATLETWLSSAVPVVQAAQRSEIAITQAYIARSLGREVWGVDAEEIIANYRNGTGYEEVYKRPFVDVWVALSNGEPFNIAKDRGLTRAVQTAATDIQLAMRDTLTMIEVR